MGIEGLDIAKEIAKSYDPEKADLHRFIENEDKGRLEVPGIKHADDLEKGKENLSEGVGGYDSDAKEDVRNKTGWSDGVIDSIGSKDEAGIYMDAGLEEKDVNGKKALTRPDNEIDLNQKDGDGITNRERMERGRPPVTKDGEELELHHIGQKQDSPLAELTKEEHRGVGNDTILHDKTKESEINRSEFAKERQEYWKNRLENMEQGE